MLIYFISAMPAGQISARLSALIGVGPLISPSSIAPIGVGAMFIYFFVFDFFYYWFHRLSHEHLLLWRFHSVHHVIEDVNSWNSYHHWTEEYLRILIVTIPMAMIIQPAGETLPILSAMFAAWGQYIHTNALCLAFPPAVRRIFSDNVYHHHHHSIEERHYNKNYAAFFPFWDWLFGTQYFPQTGQLPRTGVSDQPSLRSPLDYVLRPFTIKHRGRDD